MYDTLCFVLQETNGTIGLKPLAKLPVLPKLLTLLEKDADLLESFWCQFYETFSSSSLTLRAPVSYNPFHPSLILVAMAHPFLLYLGRF